jgi:hypothetical protein
MNGPFSVATWAALSVSLVVSTFAGVGIHDAAVSLLPSPIQIKTLHYRDDGLVDYWATSARPTKDEGYPAVWDASLSRSDPNVGTKRLCRGSGDGFYWDRPKGKPWDIQALISDACPSKLGAGAYRIKVRIEPDDGTPVAVAVHHFTVE